LLGSVSHELLPAAPVPVLVVKLPPPPEVEPEAGSAETGGDEMPPLERAARQVLERELVRRRGIGELLQKPELLERIEPSVELVKTLISHRELLNEHTRVLARKIIDQVVAELRERMLAATAHVEVKGYSQGDTSPMNDWQGIAASMCPHR